MAQTPAREGEQPIGSANAAEQATLAPSFRLQAPALPENFDPFLDHPSVEVEREQDAFGVWVRAHMALGNTINMIQDGSGTRFVAVDKYGGSLEVDREVALAQAPAPRRGLTAIPLIGSAVEVARGVIPHKDPEAEAEQTAKLSQATAALPEALKECIVEIFKQVEPNYLGVSEVGYNMLRDRATRVATSMGLDKSRTGLLIGKAVRPTELLNTLIQLKHNATPAQNHAPSQDIEHLIHHEEKDLREERLSDPYAENTDEFMAAQNLILALFAHEAKLQGNDYNQAKVHISQRKVQVYDYIRSRPEGMSVLKRLIEGVVRARLFQEEGHGGAIGVFNNPSNNSIGLGEARATIGVPVPTMEQEVLPPEAYGPVVKRQVDAQVGNIDFTLEGRGVRAKSGIPLNGESDIIRGVNRLTDMLNARPDVDLRRQLGERLFNSRQAVAQALVERVKGILPAGVLEGPQRDIAGHVLAARLLNDNLRHLTAGGQLTDKHFDQLREQVDAAHAAALQQAGSNADSAQALLLAIVKHPTGFSLDK